MNQRKHLKIVVEGLVQGVNYRQAARQEAYRLGIAGYARNEPDGSVLIEAEGSSDALARFVEWCHAGPASGRVDRVSTGEGALVGYDGFARR
jgi:acylphosphatase